MSEDDRRFVQSPMLSCVYACHVGLPCVCVYIYIYTLYITSDLREHPKTLEIKRKKTHKSTHLASLNCPEKPDP